VQNRPIIAKITHIVRHCLCCCKPTTWTALLHCVSKTAQLCNGI